jgi:hypothetical protein
LTGLLLGATLAFVWVPVTSVGDDWTAVPRLWASRRIGRLLDLVGVIGLAALGVCFMEADAFEPFLYRGGLALVALSTALVIAAAVHPRARVGRLVDRGPMRWIGTRSYAIYLWHWPIFTLTRPDLDVTLDPVSLLIVRLGLTAIMAEVSYRLVETPIRRGLPGRAGKRSAPTEPAHDQRPRRWSAPARAGALAGALAVLLSTVLVSVAVATPPAPPDGMITGSIDGIVLPPEDTQSPPPSTEVTGQPATTPAPQASAPAPQASAPAPEASTPAPQASAPTPEPSAEPGPSATAAPRPQPTILAFGESVMLQSANALAIDLGPVRVDAAVGRQINTGISILEHREATGALAETVIVQLGNNGPFYDGQFDEIMAALRDVPTVIWINVRVPREWEAHNNRIIASGVRRYPNARMVDWNAATAGRPDLFWKDGYHPRPAGARLYADLVAIALR